MAYGTKYNLTFKDYFANVWEVDIQVDGYSGAETDLIGSGNPLTIHHDPPEQWTHTSICASYAELELLEQTDDAYAEFFTRDKYAKCRVYKDSALYWQGWSIAEGYYSLYNTTPKKVKLTFVDGLTFLKSKKVNIASGTFAVTQGVNKLKNYLYQAFDFIGLSCDIYENMNIYEMAMNRSNPVWEEFYTDLQAFINSQRVESSTIIEGTVTLYQMLEWILQFQGCRIFQKDGAWYIDRIKTLTSGTKLYNRHTSAMVFLGSASETVDKDITSATGSPLMVPIEHSLYKEYDRPYSEFKVNVDYNIKQNLIKYPYYRGNWTIVGDAKTKVASKPFDNTFHISGYGYSAIYDGVAYTLGRIDFLSYSLVGISKFDFLSVAITGTLKGWMQARIEVMNESDGLRYYYDAEAKEWTTTRAYALIKDNRAVDLDEKFTVTADIGTNGQDLAGVMYLFVSAPYDVDDGGLGILNIDTSVIAVNYNECTIKNNSFKLTADDKLLNIKDIDIHFYSNPKTTVILSYVGLPYELTYVNPNLVYPNLLYRYDGSNYIPCLTFGVNIDEGWFASKTIEEILVEDIMTFYANNRFKISGTLKGELDYGNVLDYGGKRYMIVSLINNIKKSEADVILLQISDIDAYLIDEDGEYVLMEDEGNIIL